MAGRIFNIFLGVWLMVSPDVLMVGELIANNDRIIGPLVITFSVIALWECTDRIVLLNLLMGLWLLVAPWILGYENNTGIINDLISGGLIVLTTISIKYQRKHQYGGGWIVLFR
jgi:hypothetical protein